MINNINLSYKIQITELILFAAGFLFLLTVYQFELDFILADFIYAHFEWSLKKSFIFEGLLHKSSKIVLIAVYLVIIYRLILKIVRAEDTQGIYNLFILIIAIGSSVLIISVTKRFLDVDCPWNLTRYGGVKPFFSIFELDTQNVFNSDIVNENRSFHQTTNRLRIQTKDYVVLRELLFKVGDQLDLRVLAETERNLRSKPFIKGSMIYPSEQCDDGVVVQVVSKDNWTLQPGVSFGVSGGKSKYSFELQEKNLLGLGKSLNIKYKKGLDRKEKSIEYYDPNLFGSTRTMRVGYQNNSDGSQKHFNLQDPFYSFSTKYSWELDYLDWELINSIYNSGEVVDEIGQALQQFNIQAGKLFSSGDKKYHRLNVGFTSDKNIFFNSLDYPLAQLPTSRDFKYPWASYEFITEDFIKKTNFNSMGRTEDVSLGHQLNIKLGRDFSHSNTHFDFSYNKGYSLNPDNLAKFNTYTYGIHSPTGLLNTHFGINAEWHHFQSPSRTFFLSTSLDMGKNLFPEQPQYLGSETGLRGYPFRYFSGDNVWVSTVEQRFFYKWYPLRTFQFASAIFIDTGSAWSKGQNKEIFTNVGIGFRLVPTRTSGGQVIHFDLAFPTNSNLGIDSVQLQIRAKKSF